MQNYEIMIPSHVLSGLQNHGITNISVGFLGRLNGRTKHICRVLKIIKVYMDYTDYQSYYGY